MTVKFSKFKAVRPRQDLAGQLATLPYDVLSSAEARELATENPVSYLHIDKSEVDLSETADVHSDAVYTKAASNLTEFLSAGWLQKDAQAFYYLYALTYQGRTQTGLVGCASIDDVYEGIKRHEYTLPEKELDRVKHSLACDANTSPIFLTYRGNPELQAKIDAAEKELLYDFTSFYETRHQVWKITSPLTVEFPVLYIADGHHRTASAVRVGQQLRQKYGNQSDAEYNTFLAVAFPENELEILDYNRLVKKPLPADFWPQVAVKFDIEKINKAKPAKTHEIHALTKEGWWKLTPKFVPEDEVAGLDVSILQEQLLAPILSISDPKTDPDIEFVGGIRGLEALENAVTKGNATIAFTLYPPSMHELLAVADAGKIMPPKSTWFEPKLLSGLFLHDFKTK